MKGVILAGGTGTRLWPLTKILNKHLIPVGKYPMIYYAVDKMLSAGIKDILIVTGKQSAGLFTDLLGSGKDWGVKITYKIQEEAGGIAQALMTAEDFVQPQEKFIVLLGDNLFDESLVKLVNDFGKQEKGAKVFLKQVADPRRYGVPIIDENKIIQIEEKPADPKSSFSVTGIYMYHGSVFEVIKRIKPSARGELEITDVNNVYASEGTLTFSIMNGWWIDAGTFESLHEANVMLKDFKSETNGPGN